MLNMHIAMSRLKDAVFRYQTPLWGMEVALPIGMNASIQTDPASNLLSDSEGGGAGGALMTWRAQASPRFNLGG
jgi:hypothetical protein